MNFENSFSDILRCIFREVFKWNESFCAVFLGVDNTHDGNETINVKYRASAHLKFEDNRERIGDALMWGHQFYITYIFFRMFQILGVVA